MFWWAVAFRVEHRFTKDGGVATPEVEEIFADILGRAKALDPANTRKWFENLAVLHFDGGLLQIGCPDDATVQFLEDNCKSSFTHAAQQITGHLVTLDFAVDANEKIESNDRYCQPGLGLHPD